MNERAPRREWTKVLVGCGFTAADEVAAVLAELTGAGTETGTGSEGSPPVITGYLPRGGEAAALRRIEAFLAVGGDRWPGEDLRILGVEEVPDEDWNENWKRYFDVSRLTERLTVRPPWKNYTPREGERVIAIDPAMAFGTGLHESTRLVIDFIDELYPPAGTGPRRVLDVGTGTGILAMASALLGARRVLAIDNDPLAVAAARDNVARNGLEGSVAVSGKDLAAVEGTWDLITANIVHDVLVGLAGDLAGRLAAGGTLVCAGILAGGQQKSLAAALAGHGLAVTASKRDKEWTALQVKIFS